MSLSSNIAPILSYATLFCLTIIFTAFALTMQDKIWAVTMKFIAGLFWIVMAIGQFIFFGVSGALLVLSLPYAMFGLIFWVMIYHDFLSEKKARAWEF